MRESDEVNRPQYLTHWTLIYSLKRQLRSLTKEEAARKGEKSAYKSVVMHSVKLKKDNKSLSIQLLQKQLTVTI